MERRFVDDFFESGKLRLSSFRKFSKHTDEQRLDGGEGHVRLIHQTLERGGQTFIADIRVGFDAYVLCASVLPSLKVMHDFKADAAIIVLDAEGFGRAVASKIPGFHQGFDGPCSYQGYRVIESDLGHIDFGPVRPFKRPDSRPDVPHGALAPIDIKTMLPLVGRMAEKHAFFLKHWSLSHQAEWRLIWLSSNALKTDELDVVVPEARHFCARWNPELPLAAFSATGPDGIWGGKNTIL
jgi:hypothetical protein